MNRYHHIIAALVLGALLSLAGQAQAQRKSPEERYEDLKKTPLLAATLEWIVPITGHDYAGDRDAALPSAVMLMVGVTLFAGAVYSADRCQSPFPPDYDLDPNCIKKVQVVAMAGALTFLGSRIWASVSAWRLANRTNAYHRGRLRLDDAALALSVTPAGQFGLGVSLRF